MIVYVPRSVMDPGVCIMYNACTLTVRFSMRNHKLQQFVHGPHVKDDTQLCHPHGNQTPQEDGRTHRATERNWGCNTETERGHIMGKNKKKNLTE